MSDLFGIAKSGIKAYKEGLATTGQNIANVGNEQYARREAKLSEVRTSSSDVLSISSNSNFGVKVDGITRAFDEFIDVQLQNASSGLSFATSQTLILEKLEKILRPADATVANKFQGFFKALSTVSQDPSDLAARHIAVDAGEALVFSIKTLANGISDLNDLVRQNVSGNLRDFNNILDNLGQVQSEILGNSSPSSTPNSLLDQRDAHLRKLSELADISVTYNSDQSIRVTLGTSGQEQSLISGLNINKLKIKDIDGMPRVFLDGNSPSSTITVKPQSGEIAGNLAADIALNETKKALDDLTKKFVSEFNDAHKFGVDLNGNIGAEFFSLDALNIKKISIREGTAQLLVEGGIKNLIGENFSIEYNANSDNWTLLSASQGKLKEFTGTTDFKGLRFNIDGVPALGDKFTIKISNNLSENLKLKVTDGEKLAASSFYSIEPKGINTGDATFTVSKFETSRNDDLKNLNTVFDEPRNAGNAVSFVSGGAIGYLKNVNSLENFTALKSQAKIQFSAPFDSLDSNTKLKITLGSTEHIFSVGTLINDVTEFHEIAAALRKGALKSDTTSLSFSDLGLSAGGNKSSLTVTSSAQPPYASFSKLSSGTMNSIAGIVIPADEGTADLQLFTREGIQLTGKPLTEQEAQKLITSANGFSNEAQYSAKYLALASNHKYMGAQISSRTTSGSHLKSVTAIGFTNNLSAYAANSYPTSRSGISTPIKIETGAGRVSEITTDAGMMAGQIANKLNEKIGYIGVRAEAVNNVEILGIPNGRIQFDLFGNNSEASSVDITIANGDLSALVSKINSFTKDTGVSAAVSGVAALILTKADGNDISMKNFSISSGTISAQQVNRFGEKIHTTPISISDGQHLISGGQIDIISPDSFSISVGGTTQQSAVSAFTNGFVRKDHSLLKNNTHYSFDADAMIDGDALDATKSIAVAPSSKYQFTLSSENPSENIVATFKPKKMDEFSSSEIARNLISSLRKQTPQTKFLGDDFTLSDGFPQSGSVFEFQLGEQKYNATLDVSVNYEIIGSQVKIGTKNYSFLEGLEKIVSGSSFNVSGPEEDRITVGFEKNGSNFRLYATARDGVLSGHALTAASTNSVGQKNSFHVSNSSGAEILTGEIDLTQSDKSNFAEVLIGSTSYSFSFATSGDTITSIPSLPSGVAVSLVSTGTNKAKLKIAISESVSERNVRLKSNSNSSSFGFLTASAQAVLDKTGFSLSNYNNARASTTTSVDSLAEEIISINNMVGEDLVLISTGNKKPTIIGQVVEEIPKLNEREMIVKIDKSDPELVEIFDLKSGDLMGSRVIGEGNNFLFRGLNWSVNGRPGAGDEFQVLTSNEKRDDAANLEALLALAELSDITGKGGYASSYNDLVTTAGFRLRASEQNLVSSKAAHDLALDQKAKFSGVDLDTEAARLLEQQQAYQALARVLSTAKEMLDTLLRAM